MKAKDIATIRLQSQQIATTKFKTPKEIVAWMGTMQAQDYAMSKWAVGLRLPGATDESLQAAIDKGEVLRTHVLRPTWHLVAAEDIYWMIELTAPQIMPSIKTGQRMFGLSDDVLKKSLPLLEKAMRDNNHLTRDELHSVFNKAKIATNENKLIHMLIWAEVNKLICSGVYKNRKQTYALLEERIARPVKMKREEAIGRLATIYFTSHGPATVNAYAKFMMLKAEII